MSREILGFRHIAAAYGEREILKDVTLSIHEGEFAGLIGSNGTGKSTLIKCVSGLLERYIDGTLSLIDDHTKN